MLPFVNFQFISGKLRFMLMEGLNDVLALSYNFLFQNLAAPIHLAVENNHPEVVKLYLDLNPELRKLFNKVNVSFILEMFSF